MLTQDFNYNLPKEKIALEPVIPRDHARLMVLNRKKKTIEDHYFYELKDLLKEGDLLVANDSKVIPARLYGKSVSGKTVEVLLVSPKNENTWTALVRGGKEQELDFGLFSGLVKKVGDDFEVSFSLSSRELMEAVHKVGEMPMPPYIKRETPYEHDKIDYQTIYAREEGSVAAPTAGLHFTKRLIRELEEKGIDIEFVTLHVGLGTFQPVKTDVVEEHKMHAEYFSISKETAEAVSRAKKEGRRVIAVGTTTVRVLESISYKTRHHDTPNRHPEFISGSPQFQDRILKQVQNDVIDWEVQLGSGWTDIFIYPGYKFKVVDGLITNFHLPKSSLIMLVSAFAGKKFTMETYKKAVEEPYRFYSYGDAMLVL